MPANSPVVPLTTIDFVPFNDKNSSSDLNANKSGFRRLNGMGHATIGGVKVDGFMNVERKLLTVLVLFSIIILDIEVAFLLYFEKKY